MNGRPVRMTTAPVGTPQTTSIGARALSLKRGVSLGVYAAICAVATTYLARHLDQGWVPHDEGAFAQSAVRVLDGELPHRDFAELYSSGMTFMNAGVIAVLGENLIWLRVPLLASFFVYLIVVYLLARRLTSPPGSMLVVLFAVAWGLPTYPAAVPSWYLLAFSAFGTYCLVRFIEIRRARWLFLAGLFGGLSISFKITGVWYVAAAILFLLYLDHDRQGESRAPRVAWACALAMIPLLVFGVVLGVIHRHMGIEEIVYLMTPVALVCVLLLYLLFGRPSISRPESWRVMRQILVFFAGCSVPLLVLAIPYLAAGAVIELVRGAVITPQTRLNDGGNTYLTTQSVSYIMLTLPVLLVPLARLSLPRIAARALDVLATAGVLTLAILWTDTIQGYQAFWHTARALAPAIILLGVVVVIARHVSKKRDIAEGSILYLYLIMAAFLGLVQYPFAAPIYFCYFAIFVVLAGLATLTYIGADGGLFPAAVLGAFVIFGFAWMGDGDVYALGLRPNARSNSALLDGDRASIRVTTEERVAYRRVVELLRKHSSGPYAFAGPDTPELYVLADLRNPTRSLFDLLDPSDSARGDALLRTLADRDVTAIAINAQPQFSEPLDSRTVERLRATYTQVEFVGPLEVRWRLSS